MKKINKLFLSLGTIGATIAPIASVISCGSEISKSSMMAYESSSKTVYFNFNKEISQGFEDQELLPFMPKPLVKKSGNSTEWENIKVTNRDFIRMNNNFQEVTDPRYSNVDKLKNGDVVKLIFMMQNQQEGTPHMVNGDNKFLPIAPIIKTDYQMEIDYIYNEKSALSSIPMEDNDGKVDSTDPDQREKEKVHVRSNFIDNFFYGMQEYGLINPAIPLVINGAGGTTGLFSKTGIQGVETTNTIDQQTYKLVQLQTGQITSMLNNVIGPNYKGKVLTMPRNYEKSFEMPKIDLTHKYVSKESFVDWSVTSNAYKVSRAGSIESGYTLTSKTAANQAAWDTLLAKIATPNYMFFNKNHVPTKTITWKVSGAHKIATVKWAGKDKNNKDISYSFNATVTNPGW